MTASITCGYSLRRLQPPSPAVEGQVTARAWPAGVCAAHLVGVRVGVGVRVRVRARVGVRVRVRVRVRIRVRG